MRTILLNTILMCVVGCANQKKVSTNSESEKKSLAQELGADQYGMKKYVMAFLYRGPNRTQDSIKAAELQRMHLDNIGKLAEESKLVLAHPL